MAAAVCLTLAVVLLVPALAGWWLRTTVTDTSTYVDTVAPLAEDPAIQEAVTRQVGDEVRSHLETRPALRLAIDPLVDSTVRNVVTSPAFAEGWRTANETAHRQLVEVLEGDGDVTLDEDGTLSLRLATVANTVRAALIQAGVKRAEDIDPAPASFALVSEDKLEKARTYYQLLNRTTTALVVAVLVLVAAGLLLARDRRRALLFTTLGGVFAMLVLLALVAWARSRVADSLPVGHDAVAVDAVTEVLTDRLRAWARWVGVLLLALSAVTLVASAHRDRASALIARLRARPQAPYVGLGLALAALLTVTLVPGLALPVVVLVVTVGVAGLVLTFTAVPPA